MRIWPSDGRFRAARRSSYAFTTPLEGEELARAARTLLGSDSCGRLVVATIKLSMRLFVSVSISCIPRRMVRAIEEHLTGRPRMVRSILRWTLSRNSRSVLVSVHSSAPYSMMGMRRELGKVWRRSVGVGSQSEPLRSSGQRRHSGRQMLDRWSWCWRSAQQFSGYPGACTHPLLSVEFPTSVHCLVLLAACLKREFSPKTMTTDLSAFRWYLHLLAYLLTMFSMDWRASGLGSQRSRPGRQRTSVHP